MDEQPKEGNLETGGERSATPNSSQAQGQPLEANLASEIAKLQRKIDAQDGEIRALKSGKDKAVDRIEKTTGATLAKIAEYLGVDEKKVAEAQRLSVLDEIVNERYGNHQPTSTIQGRVDEGSELAASRPIVNFTSADAIREVEKFQLSANEPSFIELLRKNPNKEQVNDYILGRLAPSQPPSPADLVQSAARGGSASPSQQTLIANYKKEIQEARGKGSRFGDAIKEKYRAQGLNVDEIHFTV